MKRKWLTILILFAFAIAVSYVVGSCNKHNIVHPTTSLQQEVPAGFPDPKYTFQDNPLTEEAFQLGRKLFYGIAAYIGRLRIIERRDRMRNINQVKRRVELQ